jgi:hypothetical protein
MRAFLFLIRGTLPKIRLRTVISLIKTEEAIMPGSTLNPQDMNLPDRQLGKGHGIDALGPSDTSDSGSDLKGASGLAEEDMLDLGSGTTSDLEASTARRTAGPDVGDANLDSDSDSAGTGEHASAGRDAVIRDGGDIDTDSVFRVSDIAQEEISRRKKH